MILSRLSLQPDDMLRLKLTDAYSLHRIVYSCFPLTEDTAARAESSAFLYADEGQDKGLRRILILSASRPRPLSCGNLECRELPENWLEHERYSFRININPVRRENASRKIVPVRGREAIRQWFCEKAPRWGFQLPPEDCRVDENGVWQFRKKEQPVTLAYARISGVLQVRDKALFQQAFREGIGRGKAFGCGLLQLVPF